MTLAAVFAFVALMAVAKTFVEFAVIFLFAGTAVAASCFFLPGALSF